MRKMGMISRAASDWWMEARRHLRISLPVLCYHSSVWMDKAGLRIPSKAAWICPNLISLIDNGVGSANFADLRN